MRLRRLVSSVRIIPLALAIFAAFPGLLSVACSPAGPLRFGLVADVHFADIEPRGSRPYRESAAKLRDAVARLNEERLDFILELGDFKDMGEPPVEARTLEYLRTIEAVFAGFKGPRYHVLGNHDEDSISKAQYAEIADNSGIPKDLSYFSFKKKGVKIIVLDACFSADGAPYERGRFEWADCNIPAAELEWLGRELSASTVPAIVCLHQQLDGEGAYFVKNAAAARRVLEAPGKVLAVFQGHRHEGMFNRLNGLPYYTLKGMIEGRGPDQTAFAVVEVEPDREIRITGFYKAESLVLRPFLMRGTQGRD
jgi:hypothetical protein